MKEAFAKRHHEAGSNAEPEIGQATPSLIDFSDVEFDRLFWVEGFVFRVATRFARTTFSEGANFQDAIFSEKSVFFGAVFLSWADFKRATFRETEFRFAKFEDRVAMFDNAVFSSWADFEGANFFYASFPRANLTSATFRNAKFGSAEFPGATFGRVSFPGTTFKFTSNFESAKFRGAHGDQDAGCPPQIGTEKKIIVLPAANANPAAKEPADECRGRSTGRFGRLVDR